MVWRSKASSHSVVLRKPDPFGSNYKWIILPPSSCVDEPYRSLSIFVYLCLPLPTFAHLCLISPRTSLLPPFGLPTVEVKTCSRFAFVLCYEYRFRRPFPCPPSLPSPDFAAAMVPPNASGAPVATAARLALGVYLGTWELAGTLFQGNFLLLLNVVVLFPLYFLFHPHPSPH